MLAYYYFFVKERETFESVLTKGTSSVRARTIRMSRRIYLDYKSIMYFKDSEFLSFK